MTLVAALAAALVEPQQAHAQAPQPPATLGVERLLSDGWEIAAYGPLALANRSLILFKHKDRKYLVQCSILYDVTRTNRVQTNCYEVR